MFADGFGVADDFDVSLAEEVAVAAGDLERDVVVDSVAEDDEDDWSKAEEMREDASEEQAEYFRNEYDELSEEDRNAVDHWIKNDEDFREQFLTYYGDNFE